MTTPSTSNRVTLSLLVQDTKKEEFVRRVEFVLDNPPCWIKGCVSLVRDHLSRVPSEFNGSYHYSPCYKSEQMTFDFFCGANFYSLHFKKIDKLLPRTKSGHKTIDAFVAFINQIKF